MLDSLLAQPGVEERLVLGSRFGLMGFHGGSLERMTDVIATAAAERSGASLYTVRQPEHLRWHVPSRLFDPAHSPQLAAFLHHVDVVVAVHGYGRPGRFSTVLLGGSNRALAARLSTELRAGLDDYEIVDDLASVPEELRGLHPDNPVNRARGGGVQLELPPRVRGLGPYWDAHPYDGRAGQGLSPHALSPHTEAVVTALAATATATARSE
ncbi:MAG TPA: poly-gamma-glutamate hydrolase family protein [Microthrixaceae bacterium]|nr:poly-gamma-glutamate hydrolase family protein [Microthrixaceae bacterium]